MRVLRYLLTVVLMGFCIPGQADTSVSRLTELLRPFQSVQTLRGSFEQEKTIPLFSKPFVSTGQFLSVRNRGLVWKSQTPVVSTLIMTPGQMVEKINGQVRKFQATGTGYDGLAILLPALLNGDIPLLTSYFTVSVTETPAQWTLKLTPRNKELAEIIDDVSVLGAGNILQKVLIRSKDGGDTRVSFSRVSVSADAPSATDLVSFE